MPSDHCRAGRPAGFRDRGRALAAVSGLRWMKLCRLLVLVDGWPVRHWAVVLTE